MWGWGSGSRPLSARLSAPKGTHHQHFPPPAPPPDSVDGRELILSKHCIAICAAISSKNLGLLPLLQVVLERLQELVHLELVGADPTPSCAHTREAKGA